MKKYGYRISVFVLALSLFAAGCEMVENSQVEINKPDEPQVIKSRLSDSRDDKQELNVRFFFLPPLVPYSQTFGELDTSVKPSVEIIDLSDDSVIAEYSMLYSFGRGKERVILDEQYYLLNWYTDRFNFSQGSTYRINVSVGQTYIKLGHVDIKIIGTAKDIINEDTNTFVPLLEGRVLPIKFRIEKGSVHE